MNKHLFYACRRWQRQDSALAIATQHLNLPRLVVHLSESPEAAAEAVNDRCPHLRAQIMSYVNETAAGRNTDRQQLKMEFE